jgi:hypothetical protein
MSLQAPYTVAARRLPVRASAEDRSPGPFVVAPLSAAALDWAVADIEGDDEPKKEVQAYPIASRNWMPLSVRIVWILCAAAIRAVRKAKAVTRFGLCWINSSLPFPTSSGQPQPHLISRALARTAAVVVALPCRIPCFYSEGKMHRRSPDQTPRFNFWLCVVGNDVSTVNFGFGRKEKFVRQRSGNRA